MNDMSTPKINYGPLEALFKSADITEIMVNSWDKIFVEHKGIIVQTTLKFEDKKAFDFLIGNILDTTSGNKNQFTFDGSLPEGFRFNVTLPPITPQSATLTIRKFATKIFTLDDLIDKNSLSDKAAIFLKEAITKKLTLVVSGGTGTGKTSFLNTFSNYISPHERVVSIEDTQELRPTHPNWIHMITSKTDESKYTTRDCLMNSLRMRPDRIIIGECRGPEAYDFLQATNTGHEGSMTSVHANSAVDCLSRLENLITLGHAEIPLKYIRAQMAEGIDLIIQLRRNSNGERQVVDITEITGLENDTITRASIFIFNKKTHSLETTGYVPDCLSRLQGTNSNINSNFFDSPTKVARTA
jgi:pilus assembly protein CpaF